jgi:acyl carrier protein
MSDDVDSVLLGIQAVCREVFENPSLVLTPETTADDVPNWDSLNHLNVVASVEQRFGIRFRTSELESLRNIGDFVSIVRAKQKLRPTA